MGGETRAPTAMWTIALFFAILAAAGLAGLDGMIDRHLPAPVPGSIWAQGIALIDFLSTKESGDWLLPFILAMAGLILLVLSSTRPIGYPLLYAGLVALLAYGIADLSTPYFGRVRPSEVVPGVDLWFVAGRAFPSGHVAFYAGLLLPLALLFPRLSPLWLAPPLLVAAARVMQHDHYLSDVSASLALAAALAAGFSFVAERGRG
ncbi:MAG TPA: phosphatase PAP2 family protein [Allosphingosinicella sp.]|jgi:membrane-associated phospholipid phosphatase